jgi:hypothetical protein
VLKFIPNLLNLGFTFLNWHHTRLQTSEQNETFNTSIYFETVKGEVKAIQLQALTGPEDSRRFRLPDFKTIGT